MLYYIVRSLVKFGLLILGLKCEGLHNLPENGPVIIAANHVSLWDPLLVAVSSRRPIYFMAKEELFESRLGKLLFQSLHAFPVKRGTADRNAIRRGVEILEKGKVLGIFPEGTRRSDSSDSNVHTGVAMLALKSNAVVIPAACIGTHKKVPWGWGGGLIIRLGRPVSMSKYQGMKVNSAVMDSLSREIMTQINLLL